jgi:hypothetical protein
LLNVAGVIAKTKKTAGCCTVSCIASCPVEGDELFEIDKVVVGVGELEGVTEDVRETELVSAALKVPTDDEVACRDAAAELEPTCVGTESSVAREEIVAAAGMVGRLDSESEVV